MESEVWMPQARRDQVKGNPPVPFVPDVCAEVLSPGNAQEQIAMKTAAHLRAGAKEFIVVGLNGEVEFFAAEGQS